MILNTQICTELITFLYCYTPYAHPTYFVSSQSIHKVLYLFVFGLFIFEDGTFVSKKFI